MFVPISLVTERNIPSFPIGSIMMVMAVLNLIRVTIDGVDARIESGTDKYHPLVVVVLAK